MESDIIFQLCELGFSNNEGKAYLSLLGQNPATGYEISQRSGIPRSAIYNILKKMELNGFVSSIGDKPVKYVPISINQLSQNLTSQFEHNINSLKEKIDMLDMKHSEGGVWTIKGYDAMIDHLRSAIDNANHSIFCSIWNREFEKLKPQFSKAQERGLEIINFSFSNLDKSIGSSFSYGIDEQKLLKIWQRQIIVIVDKKAVLLGNSIHSKDNQAIWTSNSAVLNISINNIILDLTLFGQRKKIEMDDILDKMMDKDLDSIKEFL